MLPGSRIALISALLVLGCASNLGAASATPLAQQPSASAELRNAEGDLVGIASFSEDANGVEIDLVVNGLPPGPHGIHIHNVGRCTAANFASAGEHFNPSQVSHGLYSRPGPHAGDLPVLIVGSDGTTVYRTINPLVTLGQGNPAASLFDGDGTSLVIHVGVDDQISDPAGGSGAAIACGVIRR